MPLQEAIYLLQVAILESKIYKNSKRGYYMPLNDDRNVKNSEVTIMTSIINWLKREKLSHQVMRELGLQRWQT